MLETFKHKSLFLTEGRIAIKDTEKSLAKLAHSFFQLSYHFSVYYEVLSEKLKVSLGR